MPTKLDLAMRSFSIRVHPSATHEVWSTDERRHRQVPGARVDDDTVLTPNALVAKCRTLKGFTHRHVHDLIHSEQARASSGRGRVEVTATQPVPYDTGTLIAGDVIAVFDLVGDVPLHWMCGAISAGLAHEIDLCGSL